MDAHEFKTYLIGLGRSAQGAQTYAMALKKAEKVLDTHIYYAPDKDIQFLIKELATGGIHETVGNLYRGSVKAAIKRYYEGRQKFTETLTEEVEIEEIEVIPEPEPEIIEDIVEDDIDDDEVEEEDFPDFRTLLRKFTKAVANYSGYNLKKPQEIVDYYNRTNDVIFKYRYKNLVSIERARNLWAHPENRDEDSNDYIEIGRRHMIIITRELNNVD